MKKHKSSILHISTSDISGGAARAAFRLHRGLQDSAGFDSLMLVQFKDSDDNTVIGPESNIGRGVANLRVPLDHMPKLFFHNNINTIHHLQWLPERLIKKIEVIDPDIVHLHWICRGFMNIKTLSRINRPIVWTFHDMWPFTGGCHYVSGCEGYKRKCGRCPQLDSGIQNDLSRWTWKRKKKYWDDLDLNIVAPSNWMKDQVLKSSLFRKAQIQVFPNGLDVFRFRPVDKAYARNLLGLPADKKLILFGAMNATSDTRKGFHALLPALRKLCVSQMKNSIELVVFGSSKPENPPDFGLKSHYFGRLNDEISISMLLAACDLFIAPSSEDNLPNTVMEAIACGTPCVAFNVGGISDMIKHKQNGYLARPSDADDLVDGILWISENDDRWKRLSVQARKKAENNFSIESVVRKYSALYENVAR